MSRRRQKEIAIGERVSNEPRAEELRSLKQLAKKGAFLVRQFGNPRRRLIDAQGKSTRLALSARECGEPVPKNAVAARKLAKKGESMLARIRLDSAKKRLG